VRKEVEMLDKKSLFLVALACSLLILELLFSPAQSVAKTLKLGHIIAPGTVQAQSFTKIFKSYVEQKSGGSLQIEVYPSGQLGRAPDQVEGVKIGTQDLFFGHLSWWEAHIEELSVISIPFIFEGPDHFGRWAETVIVPELQPKLIKNANQRFINLGANSMWHKGLSKCIVAKKPIFTPEDIKGLRLRLWPARMIQKSWGGMGAQIYTIDWSEAYLALKQGMVEAITTPVDAAFEQRFTEVVKYVTMLDQVPMARGISINEKVWQGLTAAEQKILTSAADATGKWFAFRSNAQMEDIIENKILKIHNGFYIRVNRQPFIEKLRQKVLPELIADGLIKEEWVKKVEAVR
jgi:TRAP-type C4-dicarboxylate transport system substrate-binding protein